MFKELDPLLHSQPVRLVIALGYASATDTQREKKRKDWDKLITVLGE